MEKTIGVAIEKGNLKFFKDHYFIDDLLNFYDDYRKGKSFWERDSKKYSDLSALCRQKPEHKENKSARVLKGFIHKDRVPRDLHVSLDKYLQQLTMQTNLNLLIQKAIQSLKSYLVKRDALEDDYTGFFGGLSGYCNSDKTNAVKAALRSLRNGSKVFLSDDQYAALFDGKLYKDHVSKFEEIILVNVKKKIPPTHYFNNIKNFHK